MRKLLNEKQRQQKIKAIEKTVAILNKLNIEYFVGGNLLLDIYREKKVSNWPYGIALNVKYEILESKISILRQELEKEGFRTTKLISPLRCKINAYYKNRLCEIVAWYDRGKYRIRKKYKLPAKFFKPGRYKKLHGKKYQVLNPPIEYLEYRFGKNWQIPIRVNGGHRGKYEEARYRR
jgi:hypothetical protein